MDIKKLVGTWKLVRHEFKTADGKTFKPYGDNAVGRVMFDEHGRFSAQIMRPGRPDFNSESDDIAELKSAMLGYVAYFGTYEVDEKNSMITNKVLGALVPGWVGGTQIRHFKFEGDEITLRTPPIGPGVRLEGWLTWVRE